MSHRYLVITELFLPTKGGTAVWFDEVYRRLGGKDIHVITADIPGAAEHDLEHPNTIHRLKLKRVPWLRPESLVMYAKLLVRSLALAVSHRFDAVHAGRALPEGLVAWMVGRLTRRPVVVYAHGEELTGWGRGRKYKTMRWVLRWADRVIANSEFTRDRLVAMGVDHRRIIIISPGVDIRRFRSGLSVQDLRDRLGLEHGTRLLLSVGRLQRRKGFDTVIRCLPALLDAGHDVRYAIIGIGEDRQYLTDLAERIGVSNRVHLMGHVSMEDLPRWYNMCDLFVMVNRDVDGDTEGFGMVFLEAAACGRVAVAGSAGGTGSAIRHGETGLRVNGENHVEVAETLAGLLSDRSGTERIAANALAWVSKELTWCRVAERTKRVMGLN